MNNQSFQISNGDKTIITKSLLVVFISIIPYLFISRCYFGCSGMTGYWASFIVIALPILLGYLSTILLRNFGRSITIFERLTIYALVGVLNSIYSGIQLIKEDGEGFLLVFTLYWLVLIPIQFILIGMFEFLFYSNKKPKS